MQRVLSATGLRKKASVRKQADPTPTTRAIVNKSYNPATGLETMKRLIVCCDGTLSNQLR